MPHLSDGERRRRLGRRHGLARPATSVTAVATELIGLHSSDATTPYLAARARIEDFDVDHLDRALYDDAALVRVYGMRRTMFVVTTEDAPMVNSACAVPAAPAQRRRLAKMLEDQEVTADGNKFIADVSSQVLGALDRIGAATARELTAEVPALDTKLVFGEGRDWGGEVGLSTRLLLLMSLEALIVRDRPLGSWLSTQYRWRRAGDWATASDDEPGATVELARRWLQSFGPGTEQDLKWWTGWPLGKTRTALEEVGAIGVDLDGGELGFVLPGDEGETEPTEDWTAFLPALDPTVMGWKERGWYLGDLAHELFDRNGNAGPTIMWNGAVIGGWGQNDQGSIVFELLEDPGGSARDAIGAAAEELKNWLGPVRMTPRFRTPLERRLTA